MRNRQLSPNLKTNLMRWMRWYCDNEMILCRAVFILHAVYHTQSEVFRPLLYCIPAPVLPWVIRFRGNHLMWSTVTQAVTKRNYSSVQEQTVAFVRTWQKKEKEYSKILQKHPQSELHESMQNYDWMSLRKMDPRHYIIKTIKSSTQVKLCCTHHTFIPASASINNLTMPYS